MEKKEPTNEITNSENENVKTSDVDTSDQNMKKDEKNAKNATKKKIGKLLDDDWDEDRIPIARNR